MLMAAFCCGMIYAASPFGVSVSKNASEMDKFAAEELVSYLSKVTGEAFAMVSEEEGRFRIGSAFMEGASLGKEDFAIRTENGVTRIGSGAPDGRGTLYGLYEYLERCGVRFWTPQEEFIPQLPYKDLPVVNDLQRPSFSVERMVIADGQRYWEGKMKQTGMVSGWWTKGMGTKYSPKYGAIYDFQPYNWHTELFFLPQAKYAKEHPEWYALNNGKRETDVVRAHLCFSNLEMRKAFIQSVKDYLKEHYKPGTILGVTKEDRALEYCHCENCLREDAEEGPDHTGAYIHFLNAVAEALEKDYPDMLIHGAGHSAVMTHVPRKARLHRNILMDVCFDGVDLAGDFTGYEANVNYASLARQWKEIAPGGLDCCDYGSTFDNYLLPLPNFDGVAGRLRAMRDIGFKGICTINAHTGNIGEFSELRTYLTQKLYWNCELDQWDIIKEFCEGYYGKGGRHIHDYIRWYSDHLRKEKKAIYKMGRNPTILYDDAYVAKAKDFFAKAYAESGSVEPFKTRLDRSYYAIMFLDLENLNNKGLDSPERDALIERFIAETKRFNVKMLSEQIKIEDYLAELTLKVETPDFCKDIPSTDWFVHTVSCYPVWGWCKYVDDEASASKRPVKMATNHVQWCVYKKAEILPGAVTGVGAFDVYVYARIEPQAEAKPEDDAFKFGWHDSPNKHEGRIKVGELNDGKYHYVKIAADAVPTLTATIWVAPLDNPSIMKSIYVDHFLFIRKK